MFLCNLSSSLTRAYYTHRCNYPGAFFVNVRKNKKKGNTYVARYRRACTTNVCRFSTRVQAKHAWTASTTEIGIDRYAAMRSRSWSSRTRDLPFTRELGRGLRLHAARKIMKICIMNKFERFHWIFMVLVF